MEPRWLRLLCLSFVVMRCQPLRRALYASNQKVDSSDNLISESA
ncbi:acetyltransferase [Vibrio mimicus]|nr:acetyltransferase [Vibrio cholerae]TXX96639.1 acetyltransferase [Vibrio mimicus]